LDDLETVGELGDESGGGSGGVGTSGEEHEGEFCGECLIWRCHIGGNCRYVLRKRFEMVLRFKVDENCNVMY
jgi:hypothetical protein